MMGAIDSPPHELVEPLFSLPRPPTPTGYIEQVRHRIGTQFDDVFHQSPDRDLNGADGGANFDGFLLH
jgi:hypothetical protein